MIQGVRKNDRNIKDSHVQILESEQLMIYSQGNTIKLQELESDTLKSEIHFGESKIRFFKLFEQGQLKGNILVYSDDGIICFYNIGIAKTTSKFDFVKDPRSVSFDHENDIIFASGPSTRAFDVNNKNEVNIPSSLAQVKDKNVLFMKNDLIFIYGDKEGVVYNYKEGKSLTQDISIDSTIRCVAYHNTNKLAIGDENGKITIFSNFLSKKSKNVSTYHWHSMAVGALNFLDSKTLVSGGKEAVLVFWHEASNRKDFCPRLRGKINGIFFDSFNEKIGIRYENNSISVIRASNYKEIAFVKEIQISPSLNQKIFKREDYSVIYGEGNNINIIQQQNNNLSVLERNITSRNVHHINENGPKMKISTFCLNEKRNWALSSELIEHEDLRISRLKFFEVGFDQQIYTVNTIEVDPHASKIIDSLGFTNFEFSDIFVTLGADGSIITWIQQQNDSNDGQIWKSNGAIQTKKRNCKGIRVLKSSKHSRISILVYTNDCIFMHEYDEEYLSNKSRQAKLNFGKIGTIIDVQVFEQKILILSENGIYQFSKDFSKLKSDIEVKNIQESLIIDKRYCAIHVLKDQKSVILILDAKKSIALRSGIQLDSQISNIWYCNTNSRYSTLIQQSSNIYGIDNSNNVLYTINLAETEISTSLSKTPKSQNKDTQINKNQLESNISTVGDILQRFSKNKNRNKDRFFDESHLIPNMKAVFDFKMNKLLKNNQTNFINLKLIKLQNKSIGNQKSYF